ncbi:SRPBCC family protein [Streptomyces sp. NPDC002490]|uniref:SRPBCC family protein n=1 Tax=Streptomyces sp. NPDC002490 TaxID=3154416 RepID=UPI003332A4D4
MEHEVVIAAPVEVLRAALADPATVARSVPGFQQDAGDAPGAGRLRLRAGGTTITYRGTLRISPGAEGVTLEAIGTEVRGGATVLATVTVALAPGPEPAAGTRLAFTVTASGDGRAGDLAVEALHAAGARLLDRFAEALAAGLARPAPSAPADEDDGAEDGAHDDGAHEHGAGDEAGEAPAEGGAAPAPDPAARDDEPTEQPPDRPSDRPGAEQDPRERGVAEALDEALAERMAAEVEAGIARGDAPPAEAAHARRTMIGRSAEEVDHAPPRGRYAPVPAPETVAPGATLRWAAPAAAVVVATAIVVGRALRRRG